MRVLGGEMSWHSWLDLLGWGCGRVGRGRYEECVRRVWTEAEVAVPLGREEEVAKRGGWMCSWLVWTVGMDRFGGVDG